MAIVRWDPARDFEQAIDRFNRMFNDSRFLSRFGLGDTEAMTFAEWTPAVDIQETPEAYVVSAELPDVKKEDVKLSVQNGVLMMTGERRQEKEDKGKKWHRVERSYGRFQRSFTLPESVDDQKIHASYKDGMLHLMIPKAPATTPKTQEIKIS